MVIEDMVKAAVSAIKQNILDLCGEHAEQDLTPASAQAITQGIQHSALAAAKATFRVYIESKDVARDVVVLDGETFRFKYASTKTFEGLWGLMDLTRRLYQNGPDTKSHVPLDAAWGMVGERLTLEVREAVAFACAHVTPEEAHQLFEKSAAFHPHPTQIKEAVKRIGEQVSAHGATWDERIREQEEAPEGTRVLVASMDGANVRLNEKGAKRGRPAERPKGDAPNRDGDNEQTTAYKNAMVGSISLYGDVEEGHKCPKRLAGRYTSQMPEDGAATFKGKFEAEVDAAEAQCGPEVIKVLLCDGARPLWKYLEGNERFAGYAKLVDYWHTLEHLSLAAEALFGKSSDEATAWYDKYAEKLRDEDLGAQSILRSMDYYEQTRNLTKSNQRALATQRTFFERNKAKMTYADFRRRGLPIGSGPVEAACKSLVKTRLCRSGMRWSRPGGQRILELRTYVKSNRWDAFWLQYQELAYAS